MLWNWAYNASIVLKCQDIPIMLKTNLQIPTHSTLHNHLSAFKGIYTHTHTNTQL